MKIRYYLINKAQRREYDSFKNIYNRLGKSFYLNMLRYCKEKDGKVINMKYGEKFCDRFQEILETTINETENDYKFLIGITDDDGFYLSDMSVLGIYNFTQLINFLKSNKSWMVEDEKGRAVGIKDMKALAKLKGIKPHYKETVNALTASRIDKAIWYINQSLKDVQQAIEDEKYGTSRNMHLLELEEKLKASLVAIDKAKEELD